ncbi:SIMPL domain-containing protein [Gemmatimonadota bacterium]
MIIPTPRISLSTRTILYSLALLAVTPACAASGSTQTRVSPESEQGAPLDRVHAYEVSSAHAALATNPALAQQESGTIQVTGQAQVSVPPDMVRIAFAVETDAPNAREASTRNASTMDAVISALRRSPVEGLTIETFGYDLQPLYPRATAGEIRQIEGYRALNNISVSVKDVSAAGSLIDIAVGAGANRVASLRFQVSDPGPARLQALREAVAMAQEEARTIADAMGVPLGPPLEVQGGSNIPRVQELARARLEYQAAVSTPVEAGLQMISASVTITYRLGSHDR